MIELCVEPYCHDCLHFKAKSMTSYLCADVGDLMVVNSIVKCENAEKCKEIEKYIVSHFDAKGEQNAEN